MGEDLTHLQVSAHSNHNHLCKQSFPGLKNNFLVVRSFNFCLLVEVSKGLELGFLHDGILHLANYIRDAVLRKLCKRLRQHLLLVADPSPVLQRRPLF